MRDVRWRRVYTTISQVRVYGGGSEYFLNSRYMKKPTGHTPTKQRNSDDYMRNSRPLREPHSVPSYPLLPKDRQLQSSAPQSSWIAETYYSHCVPLSPILEDRKPRPRPIGGQTRVISEPAPRRNPNRVIPPRPADPSRLPHTRQKNDDQCFGSKMCANVVATLKRIIPCL